MKSITYSTILGLFGTLSILAAPAPLPQSVTASSSPSVPPAGDNSVPSGTAGGTTGGTTGSAGSIYTCQDEKHWVWKGVDPPSDTQDCPGDTICKEGVPGGPCFWPEGYGAPDLALTQTNASVPGNPISPPQPSGSNVPVGQPVGQPVAPPNGGAGGGPGSGPNGSATDLGPSATASTVQTSAGAPGANGGPHGTSSVVSHAGGQNPPTSLPGAPSSPSGSVTNSQVKPTASGTSSGKTDTSSNNSGNSSTTLTNSGGSGGTRYVAYWDAYSQLGGIEASQLEGVTHVILAFIDMTTWTTFVHSDNGAFDETTAGYLKKINPNLIVTGSIGGWGSHTAFETAAAGGEATIGPWVKNAVAAMTALGLDGLDLDREFPTAADRPAFVAIAKGLKAAMQQANPNAILSVAMGSRLKQISPISNGRDVDAMTQETFSELNDVVDMYNAMTYDFVNRYDTKTGHHSGTEVIENTLQYYQSQGAPPEKINIGFLNTAKYFSLNDTGSCTAEKPIGCPMGGRPYFETGGEDNGKSGWLRYNQELDKWQGEVSSTIATLRVDSWDKRPSDDKTAFPDVKSHAWYDANTKIFWTWTTGEDNKAICMEYKSKVGGVFAWAANQDESGLAGGSHMKALAECAGGK